MILLLNFGISFIESEYIFFFFLANKSKKKSKVTWLGIGKDTGTVYSVSWYTTLKIYNLKQRRQIRSAPITSLKLAHGALPSNSIEPNLIFIACWDNFMYVLLIYPY